MLKSGKKAKNPRKPKAARNIATSPAKDLEGSLSSSVEETPKAETALWHIPKAEARVLGALYRLNVSREDWEASPEITPLLWRTMGSIKKCVMALRFSNDEQVKKFLRVYKTLTLDEQEQLPLEIPCLAAGVSPPHILGQIFLCQKDLDRVEAALTFTLARSDQIRAAAKFGATCPQNFKDREMILKATGDVASPAGSSVNVNVFGSQTEPEDDDFDDGIEDSDLPSDVFNYDAKTIDGWGDQRRRLMDEDKRK